jgi:acetolactate synthase-1/2/3 large subunit
MMKLTEVIAKFLKKNGINSAFGLQGGAVVHIFDSLEGNNFNVTYCHHEESAALAAGANSKITGKPGCVVVTSGPGCTNAITGLLAAWQDSVPCIFISGQVRSTHMSYGKNVRQFGTQEVPIIDIVKPIAKYSKVLEVKGEILDVLEDALRISISGRPGPVWLDIPLDYQFGEEVDISEEDIKTVNKEIVGTNKGSSLSEFKEMLSASHKPLFVLGYGLRLSGALEEFKSFLIEKDFNFVTTWTASDYFPTDYERNLGIIGMRGQKGANKAVFDSDLIICIGTHLSIPHTTTLIDTYAEKTKKIIVNIDKEQLNHLNLNFDLIINQDINYFIKDLVEIQVEESPKEIFKGIKDLNWYYPEENSKPNPNIFFKELTLNSPESSAFIIDGGGTALYAGFQSAHIKEGQRIICSSAISAMGTGLGEVIGVHNAGVFEKLFCIIGDGSFLMNIQDLQTIKSQKIPVIISVINNNGYLAIRHTQSEFLSGKLYGTHPDWSLEMPSIEKLANGFDIPFCKLDNKKDTEEIIGKLLNSDGPVICEVVVDEDVQELFKQGYKSNEDGTFSPLPLNEMQP